MKILFKYFTSFIIVWIPSIIIAQEQDPITQPLLLLNSKMLDDARINVSFTNSFDLTPEGKILLSSLNRFYLLGWDEFTPLESEMQAPIQSFAYTAADVLLMISGNSLCYLDSLGLPVKLFLLPNNNMGIVAGDNVLYVYDKTKQKNGYAVYMLQENFSYLKVLELPAPINAVTEINKNLLFAVKNKICSVNLKNKTIKVLVQLPKANEKIISMAYDYGNDVLYFSTSDAIYTLKGKQAGCIIGQVGGLIKCYYNELYVFNPEKKFLISFYINDTLSENTDTGKAVNKNTTKKNTTMMKR